MTKRHKQRYLDGLILQPGVKPADKSFALRSKETFKVLRTQWHKAVGVLGILATASLVVVISLFAHPGSARAFSDLTQDDWTGGMGTNPTNHEYASATGLHTDVSGKLTLDTSGGTYTNWCNTGGGECDSNWHFRSPITVKNPSVSYSDYVLKLAVLHNGQMNADFSDIRFTSQDGSTSLPYSILTATESQAVVYVKIGSLLADSTETVYMYYGNASATSLSSESDVFTFRDSFDEGNPTAGFIGVSPEWLNVADGVATWAQNSEHVEVVIPSQGRSESHAYQVDFRMDLSTFDCNTDVGNVGGIYIYSNDSDSTVTSFAAGGRCDDSGKYWTPMNAIHHPAQSQTYYDNAHEVRVRDQQWVTVRITTLASGDMVEYSLDGGATFSEPTFYERGSSTETIERLWLGNGSVNWSFKNLVGYDSDPAVQHAIGQEEILGGYTGSLESAVFDLGDSRTVFGNVNITTNDLGDAILYVRGGENSPSDADYEYCGYLHGGTPLSSGQCASAGDRYIQYKLVMTSDSNADLEVYNVSLQYIVDTTSPADVTGLSMERVQGGDAISDGQWINVAPYVSWSASSDDVGGSGVVGYCAYLGTDNTADLSTTAGLITATGIDVNSHCAYATTDTHLDLATVAHDQLQSGQTYYVKVQAIDQVGNLSATASVVSFKYDDAAPQIYTNFNIPAIVNSKTFSITWLTLGQLFDADSGVAGFKYCVTSVAIGFSGCNNDDNNWYGLNHGSGKLSDTSDVVPFSDGAITTTPADFDRMDDSSYGFGGVTLIAIRAVDNAGNPDQQDFVGSVLISHATAAAPTNLQVSPSSNTENQFSFTWSAPNFYIGSPANIDYCWTVNVSIAADGSNCNWTGKGITQLANGPYATQQGTNTLYMAAKDDSNNFDGTQYTQVSFTASTAAPGVPQNLDISDVSVRATSSWKLAMSWSAPTQVGAGIAGYRIYRSTDNSSFTQVGTTSADNLSFIDSGLTQVTYYYQVRACDNAGSCSVASTTVSKKPTGRFTEPADLVSGPVASNLNTRKVTLSWVTDRDSDSKIAFGTASGQYQTEEVGNSAQTASHAVNLTNLQPGTQYFYVAKWTDQDGNTGTSPEKSFTTLPAPTVSEVSVSSLGVNAATISFTTKNAAKAKLYYGLSDGFGGVKTINTSTDESSYSLAIDGLTDGVKYFYKINPLDSDGNEYEANTYSLTTPARPRISNLRFQAVDGEPSSTMKVTWNTNVPSTSRIAYGPANVAATELIDSKLVTDHELVIRGLIDDTDYGLIAESRDAAGNVAVSDRQVFHTALDTRPPKISELTVETGLRGSGSESRGQIIVSWKTDEPSTSQVAFGQGQTGELGSKTPEDGRLTTEHVVIVSDLPTSSIYRVEAISHDRGDNIARSEQQSAIVGRGADNIFSIIFNALQQIFGLGQQG